MIRRSDTTALATLVRRLVVDHASRGVGSDGRRLKPLKDGKPATLKRTGTLLGSIQVRATDTDATVVATAPYAQFVERDRPFIGLTEQEQRQLDDEFLRRLDLREREFDQRRRR